MARKVISGQELQDGLSRGVDILADAVGSTLGPLGRNAIIETPYGATTVTKDGVTVAELIDLEDPIENLAAQILKQAAQRTAKVAGDGTTSATIIAQTLYQEARKLITSGVAPIHIKQSFERFLTQVIPLIRDKSLEVSTKEDIYQIALISANNDAHIASLIAQAMEYVGKDGTITLEESKTGTTEVTLVDGYAFERPYASPYFVTNPAKGEVELDNPLIFITDKKLRYTQEIIPILELAHANSRPLLIIADDIEGQVLQTLAINKISGTIKVSACRAPSYGENRLQVLQDIAAHTSATVISESSGQRIEDTTFEQLGEAAKVRSTRNETIIIDGAKDEARTEERAEQIRLALKDYTGDSYYHKQLQTRLSKLTAKVAILHVGAATETELKEKKARVDDALRATTCAVQKGYVVGGGTLLAKLSKQFANENDIISTVFARALSAPLRRIAQNAGTSPDLVLAKVLEEKNEFYGYNALTNEYTDLIVAGIIDPTLVVEQALLNAVSAANMLILSATGIYNIDRTPPYSPGNLGDFQSEE